VREMHPEAVAFLSDFNRIKGFLYACAGRINYRRTGAVDDDDLVQEGFVAIWKAASNWTPTRPNGKRSGKFSSYAFSVARHAMLGAIPGMRENILRRWYFKKKGREAPDAPMEMNGLARSMETIGDSDKESARRLAMNDAIVVLRKMDPRDAMIVIDRFFFGYTQKEIGAKHGMSQNGVSQVLKRALGRNGGRAACDDPKWKRDAFIARPTKRPMRMTVLEDEA